MPEDAELTEPTDVDIPEASTTEDATEPTDEATYTIKVDGAEQEVTLSELQNGYQRQSDYTRKTQELAAERQRLQQAETIASALESDPAGTLKALSTAFGIDDTPAASIESDDSWADADPISQRLANVEAQMERQVAAARQAALDKEVHGLKERYGDFDEQALFQHALSNRIPNLDAAYAHMKFGEVADTAARLQADKDVTEAKRNAAVVEGGKATQAGVVGSSDSGKSPSSIREAFALAKQQIG